MAEQPELSEELAERLARAEGLSGDPDLLRVPKRPLLTTSSGNAQRRTPTSSWTRTASLYLKS
jgi:hypothetical protein